MSWGQERRERGLFQIICLKASSFISDTLLFLHNFFWTSLDLELDFNGGLNNFIIFTFLLVVYLYIMDPTHVL